MRSKVSVHLTSVLKSSGAQRLSDDPVVGVMVLYNNKGRGTKFIANYELIIKCTSQYALLNFDTRFLRRLKLIFIEIETCSSLTLNINYNCIWTKH